MTHNDRKSLVAPSQSISRTRQAELLEISRASLYYQPVINQNDLRAMRYLDAIYTKCPFYGSRKLRYLLKDNHDIIIGRHHIRRLMRIMGLEAIYPKKSRYTSTPDKQNKVYPYLIRGVVASHPNHIWGTDITYIRLEKGWCYLTAILDWYSRYVVGWELSSTMESEFCIQAMGNALQTATPEISNSDQGSQFTDHRFTGLLAEHGVKISMDGRGRCMDNIFTERLWRNVKYEEVYLKSYRNIDEARIGIANYFQLYNNDRPHQSLAYKTPLEFYYGKKKPAAADNKLVTSIPSTISTIVV